MPNFDLASVLWEYSGQGAKTRGEHTGDAGEDGHDGGAGDGNLGDVAPALHEHQTVDVADDTQDQTDEQADVHGFTEEADLLLDGAGIDADLVETELGNSTLRTRYIGDVTVVVRGGHDATGVRCNRSTSDLLHGLSD